MSAQDWQRVSRERPCEVCGKGDWCTVSADSSAACCMRVESAKPMRNGGWLHKLKETEHRERVRRALVSVGPTRLVNMAGLAARFAAACGVDRAARIAAELGVSALTLHRLGLGWDGVAYTFPMRGADGRVCGIRRRLPDGRKLSVKGGREGLFIPANLPGAGELLICEGPTDTAAILDMGYPAIGRPSCTGGVKLCCTLARGRDAVIVADADPPGQRGAAALASVLRLYCPSVRIISPPAPFKDARAWRQAGATADDVQARIDAADVLKLGIQTNTTAGRGRRIQGISSCVTQASY